MMITPILHRAGTYRAVDPCDTWSRISPELRRFGITRVADITDLDEIGIPTFVAYRPDAATVAVSIGTGLNPMQARVSAAMESIEVWHAENPVRQPEFRAPAADLSLPYDLRALNLPPRSPLTQHSVLDWITGVGLLSGQRIPVPLESVRIDFTGGPSWSSALFQPTTNGVASGNTAADATLHGLMEVMERECIAEYLVADPAELRYCDVDIVESDYLARIVARLRDADCSFAVIDITSRLEIPCYAAQIWSADIPYCCGGFGCHVDAQIAAGRALLEAAQSRLGTVSGARDDIDDDAYQPAELSAGLADLTNGTIVPFRSTLVGEEQDLGSVVRYCAERIAEVTGFEPFSVDLAHSDIGIPVQKIYAPGVLMFDHDEFRTRRQTG